MAQEIAAPVSDSLSADKIVPTTRAERISQRGITNLAHTFVKKGTLIAGTNAAYSTHTNKITCSCQPLVVTRTDRQRQKPLPSELKI